MKSGLSHQTILSGGDNTFLGAVTENYVAGQLASKGYHLYYWESNYEAELDFVLQKEDVIYGIEVKSEERTKSKSLSVFSEKYKNTAPIRFSLKNFEETDKIKAIPLYAVFCF